MSSETTVNVVRAGTTIMSNIAVQIDANNLDEKNYDRGAAPYDEFLIYATWANPAIQRGDHLVDPSGNTYIVANRPEQFDDGHTEIEAIMPVGS